MVTFHTAICDKCRRNSPIDFTVEPEEAWRTVVLNRWKRLCPTCFDNEPEKSPRPLQLRELTGDVVARPAGVAEPLHAKTLTLSVLALGVLPQLKLAEILEDFFACNDRLVYSAVNPAPIRKCE